MDEQNESLEQYDYSTNDYMYRVEDKYSHLIGIFLIRFSELEHSLNITIADIINDRTHEHGFIIVENLTTNNKIQLFYKFYLLHISALQKDRLTLKLQNLKIQLEEINSFRNKIVHANWQTLNKQGMVRTKIAVDSQHGYVLFRKFEMLPKTIRLQIKSLEKLILTLENFSEETLNMP